MFKGKLDEVNDVAIKFLNPDIADKTSSIYQFSREIDIMRACRAVNIVSFMGAWVQQVCIIAFKLALPSHHLQLSTDVSQIDSCARCT